MVTKPISVALIIGKWHGYGVETLTLSLARCVDPRRVKFTFIVDSDSNYLPEMELRDCGADLVVVPPYQRLFSHRAALASLFEQNKFDIVHAHTSTLVAISLSVAMRTQVPVRIAHVHTMAGKGEHLKNLIKYSLKPFSKMFATHLATSSTFAGEWLFGERAMESGEVFYLPVARELSKFKFDSEVRERTRSELGLTSKDLCVGHLGRFVAQKNHLFLLRVFAKVREIVPSTVLVLGGDGELLGEAKAYAQELSLGESVQFLGQRSDASALYQAFDAFILPSLYEGVPGTGVEAQAAGLPFIYADTVTPEVKLLPSAKRIPLDAGLEMWAKEIIESLQVSRYESAIAVMEKAGFGVTGAADMLTDYYEKISTSR